MKCKCGRKAENAYKNCCSRYRPFCIIKNCFVKQKGRQELCDRHWAKYIYDSKNKAGFNLGPPQWAQKYFE